jgi:hypothetical protein
LTNSGGRFAPGGCTVDLQLPAASDDERRERMQKYVLDALDAELKKRDTLTRILEYRIPVLKSIFLGVGLGRFSESETDGPSA